ncbi:MAG TPA: hypothetical protein VMV10_23385 [Pirellulales bacterium]|nr:hypothetical protein [Pirellulales bacterium]
MRLAIFSLTLFSFALLAADFAEAQTPYVGGGEHEVVMGDPYSQGGYAAAGNYAYRAPMGLGGGPNSTWGYGGTCCANVWDGYCEQQQGCHRLGCNGCQKGSLWCKLKCMRIKIFGGKQCGCQQGCCHSHCSHGCGNACGGVHGGEMAAPPADYDSAEPAESMPLSPQARSPKPSSASEAAQRARNGQAAVRQSWSMPRMSSVQGSTRR